MRDGNQRPFQIAQENRLVDQYPKFAGPRSDERVRIKKTEIKYELLENLERYRNRTETRPRQAPG